MFRFDEEEEESPFFPRENIYSRLANIMSIVRNTATMRVVRCSSSTRDRKFIFDEPLYGLEQRTIEGGQGGDGGLEKVENGAPGGPRKAGEQKMRDRGPEVEGYERREEEGKRATSKI